MIDIIYHVIFYIYLIHNILNNKVYIGKTTNPLTRWRKHLEVAFSQRTEDQYYLHKSIRKYGKDNFSFSIIQQFYTEQQSNLAEIYWINYFNTRNNNFGYNLTEGGEGCVGRVLSEFTKNKIRNSLLSHCVSNDTKDKIRNSLKGKLKTQQFKDKISQKMLGRKVNNVTRQKISHSRLGEKNPMAKMNEQTVRQARYLYNTESYY